MLITAVLDVEVKELHICNCHSSSIVGLTDAFVNLEILSIINVGLTSLKGFPKLPNLRRLELSDNRISGGLNLLSGSPKLTYLNLAGNKIKDISTLEPLKDFKNLMVLDLFYCGVTSVQHYRQKVFDLLSSLKYLDCSDINGKDAEDLEAEDEGEEEELDEEGVNEAVGFSYLEKEDIDKESEGDDFNPDGVDDEDEDKEEEGEEEKSKKPEEKVRKQ